MRARGAALCGIVAVAACAILAAGIGQAQIVGGANVRASFRAWATPHALPRVEAAPIALHMEGALQTVDGNEPPQLRRIAIALNRHGRVSTAGLPICPERSIMATNSEQALAACRNALVGRGRFSAHIAVPSQAPFPARGGILAFNSVLHGHRVILVHIFGTAPVPTTQVLVLKFQHQGHGTFGTTLSARLPSVAEKWGYATGFRLTLYRLFTYRGRTRSFVSASCPAPKGFSIAFFTAAKGTYYLAGGHKVTRVLEGRCRVSS